MNAKQGCGLAALVLALGLLAPTSARAGWYFDWHHDRNCPPSYYPLRHYWAPAVNYIRDRLRPSNLDEFAPGPLPPAEATYQMDRFRCPSMPPAPSAAYADPGAYYGRPETGR
jgi:hypothetical protein